MSGLPFVIGEAPKALPAPTRTVDAEMVRELAEKMTPKMWRALRTEMLALATREIADVKQKDRPSKGVTHGPIARPRDRTSPNSLRIAYG